MVKYRVDQVSLAWKDNGHKMWRVEVSDTDNNYQFHMLTWGIDEIDARSKVLAMLEEEQTDDDQD